MNNCDFWTSDIWQMFNGADTSSNCSGANGTAAGGATSTAGQPTAQGAGSASSGTATPASSSSTSSNGSGSSQSSGTSPAGNGAASVSVPGLVKKSMGCLTVLQHVFHTVYAGNECPVPSDMYDHETGYLTTGHTRSFATLRKPFKLAPMHVDTCIDPNLTVATSQVIVASQALAMVEDMLFLQGRDAQIPETGLHCVDLPPGNKEKLQRGLLGIAESHKTIRVHPQKKNSKSYGLETYNAVMEGVMHFAKNLHGHPHALILSADIWADIHLPLEGQGIVTTQFMIHPLLSTGPLVLSAGMPPRTGLLASLGGRTTTLYIGAQPQLEFNGYENSLHHFSVRESIQFVNTDPHSLILLKFVDLEKQAVM